MFLVNKLSRALIYKSCNKYFWRKKKNSLISRRQRFNCQTYNKHTLTHTPTQYVRDFYTSYLGHKLSTVPLHPIKKGTTEKIPILPSPHNLENPPFTPMYKVSAQWWRPTSHTKHAVQMSPAQSLHGMATGRYTGFFPIVVNTQKAPL